MAAYFTKDVGKPRHHRNRDGSWSTSASTGRGRDHDRRKPAASHPSLSDGWGDPSAPVADVDATPKFKRRSSKLRRSQQSTPRPNPDLTSPSEVVASGPVDTPTESVDSTWRQSTEIQCATSRGGDGSLQGDRHANPASHADPSPPSTSPADDHQKPPSADQRYQSNASAVPTWVGPSITLSNRFGGGQRRIGRNNDSNSTKVANPRNWGQTVDTPASLTAGKTTEDGMGWSTPAGRCKTWVARVSPTAPPGHELVALPEAKSPVSNDDGDDLPPRPDSVRKVIPPTTVYYSDGSSSSPKIVPSTAAKSDVSGDYGGDSDAYASADRPSTPPASTPPVEDGTRPLSTIAPLPPITSSHYQTQSRGPRQGWKHKWTNPKKWWREELHPMQNPLFASRRLCITTPFPLRSDNLKSLMYQHFAKYGPIRLVQSINCDVDTADTAFVIFNEERSVREVLDDPTSVHCTFQSTSRTQTFPFDIAIRQIPSTAFTRFIWVKLTGCRPDTRSRSASPSFGPTNADTGNSEVVIDARQLPEEVTVWAVPHIATRNRRLRYRVFVAGPGHDPSSNFQEAERKTGKPCEKLYKINFGRRFPEREITAQLVDSFVDIISIIKPSERTNFGWIFECAGNRDVQELLTTVSDMPGITIRYATPAEYSRPPSPAPTQASSEACLSVVAHVAQGESLSTSEAEEHPAAAPPEARSTRASAGPDEHTSTRVSTEAPKHPSARHVLTSPLNVGLSESVSSKSTKTRKPVTRQPPAAWSDGAKASEPQPRPTAKPEEDTREHFSASSSESTRPDLVRSLVLTYRGRVLREDMVGGQPRYIDEAAIFVGHLAKDKETQLTLLSRFERYGSIAAIEYNPRGAAHATFARARILFQDKLSARLAIERENGAISFGSALKVEERRVLPHDVQAREMYMDSCGRAISPSMVSQYSPPSPPTLPKVSFAYPAVPSPQQGSWFSAMGSAPAMPAMPAMMPTAMTVQAPGVYGHGQDLQGVMMPVMWPMGFGMYHGTLAPTMTTQFQQAGTTPPMDTPPGTLPPPSNGSRQIDSRSAPQTPETKTTTGAPSGNTKAACGTPVPLMPPRSSTVVSSAPRVTGTRYQDGLFTPTYDANDLKMWRDAQALQNPNQPPPAATAPADCEYLPLLPLFTGGHDPASTLPTPLRESADDADGRSLHAPSPSKKPPRDGSFNGDAMSLAEAATSQVSSPATRGLIRAQLSQSFQVDSPSMSNNVIPPAVPGSNQAGPLQASRGSASSEHPGSRAPNSESRKWDDAPRNRGPKGRHRPQAFTRITTQSPLSQIADYASEGEATGWSGARQREG